MTGSTIITYDSGGPSPLFIQQEQNMSTTIWHNPRCSKSRMTLGLIQEKGVEPEVVKYLEAPPTKA